MNNKTSYELKITDKLHELPVPDMQDAIWARIERTLDLEMPTDDGGGGGNDSPANPFSGFGGGSWIGGFGLSVFIVAALTIFIISKTNNSNSNSSAPQSTPSNGILELERKAEPPPNTTNTPFNNPAPVRTNNPLPAAGDTASALQPVVFNPQPAIDSSAGSTAIVEPPPAATQAVQQPSDTAGVKKRGKGVAIDPNEYRIVPKKDSTKQ